MSQPSVSIGPFVVGEKPLPVRYTFLDGDGDAINLTGYTAKFVFHERFGAMVTANAAIPTPSDGAVEYVWVGTEFPTPGHYRARFWVGNTLLRFASVLITFDVASAEGPVPSI